MPLELKPQNHQRKKKAKNQSSDDSTPPKKSAQALIKIIRIILAFLPLRD